MEALLPSVSSGFSNSEKLILASIDVYVGEVLMN